MTISINKIKKLAMFIMVSFFLTSCVSKKDIVYFQNAKDAGTIVDTDTFVSRFKVDDNVSIVVTTFDLEAVKPFNIVVPDGSSQSEGSTINYLVDVNGNIDYPVLGKIKLLGLTIDEAKELIKEKLSVYLEDPIVNIRILNFEVTILGAVNAPGNYTIQGERISLLKALGMAGDLNIKGRRDNILVVRDFKGSKTTTRIDLTSTELFNSPVYYLTQNDVVYVEQNKSGVSSASGDSRLGVILSISSFFVSMAILLTRI